MNLQKLYVNLHLCVQFSDEQVCGNNVTTVSEGVHRPQEVEKLLW